MENQTGLCYCELPENQLAELCKAGHEAAFQEISDRYYPRLLETASAMLFSHQKAAEAVEKSLQSARDSLQEYHNESLFFTWICRHLIKYILNNYDLPEKSAPYQ